MRRAPIRIIIIALSVGHSPVVLLRTWPSTTEKQKLSFRLLRTVLFNMPTSELGDFSPAFLQGPQFCRVLKHMLL